MSYPQVFNLGEALTSHLNIFFADPRWDRMNFTFSGANPRQLLSVLPGHSGNGHRSNCLPIEPWQHLCHERLEPWLRPLKGTMSRDMLYTVILFKDGRIGLPDVTDRPVSGWAEDGSQWVPVLWLWHPLGASSCPPPVPMGRALQKDLERVLRQSQICEVQLYFMPNANLDLFAVYFCREERSGCLRQKTHPLTVLLRWQRNCEDGLRPWLKSLQYDSDSYQSLQVRFLASGQALVLPVLTRWEWASSQLFCWRNEPLTLS